ncbi:YjzC family protein [Geotoga petraea]|uniref:YjzC family protein n=1 Tax=Geotoga petraea TaxID=28234 RepID=A0A4Z0W2T9_9BACT|nr:YjzC family protein [Geotoga petraea]TGG87503.1 YjzC family protein [Geotoga petraea]
MIKLQKPGEKPNKTGEYIETGPYGGKTKNPRYATITAKCKKLPPVSKEGNKWKWLR